MSQMAVSLPTPSPSPLQMRQTKRAAAKPAATPSPKASAPAAKGGTKPARDNTKPAESATALLARAKAATAALTSYQCVIQSVDVRKDGNDTMRTQTMIRYQAPHLYRFDVQESSTPLATGSATVLRHGDSTIKAKAGGLLGMMTLTLPLTDGRVASTNGWTPDKLLMHPVLARYDAHYTVTTAGTSQVAGIPVTVLKLSHPANPLDPAIAYELLALDSEGLVRSWSCHSEQAQLYQFTVQQLIPNPSLPEATFTL